MIWLADHSFRVKRIFLGRYRVRRTQVYCVGSAKSGTHSIRSMFSRNVGAKHEPQWAQLIDRFFDWQERRISEAELRAWIFARDREMGLEMDSSWLNILILEQLVAEFPRARFVLTIRDCYSWLNSEFRRVQNNPSREPRRVKVREFLYRRPGAVHLPEEQVLQAAGLHPLDGYLLRWRDHNEKVLSTVPAERLLVIRTSQIRQRATEIADFAGLPRYALRLEHTHVYKNPVSRNIIQELDRNFLEQKVEQHCRPLMKRFFPEIKSLDDTKL